MGLVDVEVTAPLTTALAMLPQVRLDSATTAAAKRAPSKRERTHTVGTTSSDVRGAVLGEHGFDVVLVPDGCQRAANGRVLQV